MDQLNQEILLQDYLADVKSDFDKIDQIILDSFTDSEYDFSMICRNVSLISRRRPHLIDIFTNILIQFEEYYSKSYLTKALSYPNFTLLRRYYEKRHVSFKEIEPFVLSMINYEHSAFLFGKELEITRNEFPDEYIEDYTVLVKDDWKVWGEIVKFGYAPDSLEYLLKFDIIELFPQVISNPTFSFKTILDTNTFDFGGMIPSISVLGFAALYGSVECFKCSLLNGCNIDENVCNCAFKGGNNDIVHICEQSKCDFSFCCNDAITFFWNELIEWLITNHNLNQLNPLILFESYNVKYILQYFDPNSVVYFDKSHDLLKREYDYQTPLHYASRFGNIALVEFFISNGAIIDSKNKERLTPLYTAAKYGHLEIVKILESHGANINYYYGDECPLHIACENGHFEVVQFLVLKGADVNYLDDFSCSALYLACLNGHYPLVEFLVSHGADINQAREDHMTPLHIAACNGFINVIHYLISNGADINALDNEERTPLYFACKNGRIDVVKCLVENGADMNFGRGGTPLHSASKSNNLGIVEYLLSMGANVNSLTGDQSTPLHFSARKGHFAIVDTLILNGANINAKDCELMTPLHRACETNRYEIVELLILNGADINEKDSFDWKPIHYASVKCNKELIYLLVYHGAHIEVLNNNYENPFMMVSGYKKKDLRNELMHFFKIWGSDDHENLIPYSIPESYERYFSLEDFLAMNRI